MGEFYDADALDWPERYAVHSIGTIPRTWRP